MLPGKKYTPEEIVQILLKRWWLILAPAVVGLAAGIFVFTRIPVQYRSETLIMVVPQRIPDSYVKSTVTARVEDRLASINEQILSRSRLERIISDFDLYRPLRERAVMEDVVQRMRSDIKVTIDKGETFRVTYASASPRTAQEVTERLASLYIEENLKDRESLAESTSSFIDSQLVDAKRRLVEQEKKLEEYRRRYAGQLPSQIAGNLQAIQNAQLQLQSLRESMNRARERRLLIERQLADAQTLPASVIAPGASAASPDGTPQLTAAQQLEAARTRLETISERYTPDHPDVRALRRTIAELEAKAAEEARRPPAARTQLSPTEVARQKRIGDLKAELEVIDHQLATSQAEEGRVTQVVGGLQSNVNALPTRESDLVELTRDYSTLQESYSSLLTKREEAKIAANLERRQIGEQFRILDPASLPERPYNQKLRFGAVAGGALGGLAIGLAIIGLLEYRDSTFKSEEEVFQLLSLPVLALVPVVGAEAERTQRRRFRSHSAAAAVRR